nr:protein kinesin light chain-related 1 [Tanacetum cinerariifolium]
MPGLVSVKTPPRITIPEDNSNSNANGQIRSSPAQRRPPSPSPSTSRAKPSPDRTSGKKKSPEKHSLLDESSLDNPDLGPFLLKLARDTIASGDGPSKALDYALRASKSFERCAVEGEPSLDLAMCLHVVAAIYCSLGRFEEAIPVLDRAIKVPEVSTGADHALAAFSGYMQLGDTHSMLGQLDKSIECYKEGLKIQMEALGDTDPRVAETCRYLAEAHVQAMQFDEADTLCKRTLEIHRVHSAPASLEEAADRRLMALICEAKGDYETALEHLHRQHLFVPGTTPEDIASGMTEISAIYESFNEPDEALRLLQKSMKLLEDKPGQQSTIAGVEARMGVMFYMVGRYEEARGSFESAVTKLRASGERKSAFFGVVLNQMGLACVQLFKIDEAAELFEEAREILEQECGPCHQDTLGVYSNLAATYDALG